MMVSPDVPMTSYAEGLIPNDVVIKLRTSNPYQVETDLRPIMMTMASRSQAPGDNGFHPLYRFSIEGKEAAALSAEQVENALDQIKVVPNPYYGFSEYETSQFTTTVKITNLPAKCTVTIYTLGW